MFTNVTRTIRVKFIDHLQQLCFCWIHSHWPKKRLQKTRSKPLWEWPHCISQLSCRDGSSPICIKHVESLPIEEKYHAIERFFCIFKSYYPLQTLIQQFVLGLTYQPFSSSNSCFVLIINRTKSFMQNTLSFVSVRQNS